MKCRHVLQPTNDDPGTWAIASKQDGRKYVACRVCGKFYGCLDATKKQKAGANDRRKPRSTK